MRGIAIYLVRCPIQANEATLKNLSDDREAMKQSIRSLRARIEQLAGERERAEKDSLEHTRLWQERAEGLKAQGLQVIFFCGYVYVGHETVFRYLDVASHRLRFKARVLRDIPLCMCPGHANTAR